MEDLSISPSSFWHAIQTSDRDHCACQLSPTVFSRQDVCLSSRVHAYIIGSGQNLRPSRRGVRPRELWQWNESTSVIVSVQQSGRLLVPTDNQLSVGLVSNKTTTISEESSCYFVDRTLKHLKVKVPDKVPREPFGSNNDIPTRFQNVKFSTIVCINLWRTSL